MNLAEYLLSASTARPAARKKANGVLHWDDYERAVCDNPGSTIAQLAKVTGRSERRISLVLGKMREAKIIKSVRGSDGIYRHYPEGNGALLPALLGLKKDEPYNPSARTPGYAPPEAYIKDVEEHPGTLSHQTAARLGRNNMSAGRMMHMLAREGKIRKVQERYRGPARFYPIESA